MFRCHIHPRGAEPFRHATKLRKIAVLPGKGKELAQGSNSEAPDRHRSQPVLAYNPCQPRSAANSRLRWQKTLSLSR
jgi:hypothetical protein